MAEMTTKEFLTIIETSHEKLKQELIKVLVKTEDLSELNQLGLEEILKISRETCFKQPSLFSEIQALMNKYYYNPERRAELIRKLENK